MALVATSIPHAVLDANLTVQFRGPSSTYDEEITLQLKNERIGFIVSEAEYDHNNNVTTVTYVC